MSDLPAACGVCGGPARQVESRLVAHDGTPSGDFPLTPWAAKVLDAVSRGEVVRTPHGRWFWKDKEISVGVCLAGMRLVGVGSELWRSKAHLTDAGQAWLDAHSEKEAAS